MIFLFYTSFAKGFIFYFSDDFVSHSLFHTLKFIVFHPDGL